MSKKIIKKFSLDIVVPCYNEEGNIKKLIDEIKRYKLDDYRIIFINDGSYDDTLGLLKKISRLDKRIKYVSFSRNFGHQAALRAGLAVASADVVITMDADLQHPPKLIPKMIAYWQEGYQIVYTQREDKNGTTSFVKKNTSQMFYKLMNGLSGLNISLGAADYRLLDHNVVRVINEMPEKQLFFRGFIAWCGFRQYAISYLPDRRFAGKSSYTLKKMIALAFQGITSFSVKPLRLAVVIGFSTALIGVFYGAYALWQFIANNTIAGWTSVTVVVLILGGVQLIILGIMGEYIGRLFMETKSRPDYIVMEENL